MTADIIQVVLADDHLIVRSGLKSVLGTAKDIAVIGEASNGAEAVALVERLKPEVVVMDLSMAKVDGLEATRQIVAAKLATRVLVLTMHGEEEYLMAALEAGAAGYLVKSAAERELVDAVRAVAHGDMYVQPTAARVLFRGVKKPETDGGSHAQLRQLTDRERDVLKLIAEGYSGPDIGDTLGISAKTVETYKQRINEKLGIMGRPAYVRFALRAGVLGPDTLHGEQPAV
jgi:two-component system, NarL family, response regulator NreC